MIYYLGFRLPISIILDGYTGPKDGMRDASPRQRRCCLCKRVQATCYRLGIDEWVCQSCLHDQYRALGYMPTQRRPIDTSIPEPIGVVRPPIDPMWDRWLA